MSSGNGHGNDPWGAIGTTVQVTRTDEQLQALAADLQREKDRRNEERFVWIVVTVILGDIVAFQLIENPTGPFFIVLLQCVMLLSTARFLGVEHVEEIISAVVAAVTRRSRDQQ